MLEAIIFDKDQTLTGYFNREPDAELAGTLQKLVDKGIKLFVVSGTGPNPDMPEQQWIEIERQRKISELEKAGIPVSLFTEIHVALPKTDRTFALIPEFAEAKFVVMQDILSRHAITPKNVLSIGDSDEVEGVASRKLGIKFMPLDLLSSTHSPSLSKLLQNILESMNMPSQRWYLDFLRKLVPSRFSSTHGRQVIR